MNRLSKYLFMFYIGFTTYISIEVAFRQYSFLAMGLVGGLIFLLLDGLNDYISWDMDLLLQGCIGSLAITFMEFVIGNMYLVGLVPKMWDYSNMWMNYKGIVCIPFSLLWILLSIGAIFLADSINYYVFKELPVPYYKLFGNTIIRFRERK